MWHTLLLLFLTNLLEAAPTTFERSLYGEQIVSNREDQVSIQYQYGVVSNDVSSTVASTGSVLSSNSMAIVSTGAGATGSAQIQSNNENIYHPGHESYAFFTAMWPNGSAANSVQWIGTFNSTDGVAVGYNGTTFSILYRQNGVDTTIAQSSFNGDKLNGTDASGFTLNTATLNVFRIGYGWLGANEITFQILDQQENWITFHTINRANSFTTPTFFNAIFPMTALVQKTAGATDLRIATASWNAGSISTLDTAGQRCFQADQPNVSIGLGETHLLTIRNKTTYQGKVNVIPIQITFVEAISLAGSLLPIIIRLRKNATVTGTSFSDVDTQNSVVQVSTTGDYTGGTGTTVLTSPINSNDTGTNNFLVRKTSSLLNNVVIILYPGETLTVTGITLLGLIATPGTASLVWMEFFG